MTEIQDQATLVGIGRLKRDVRQAFSDLGPREARFLVDEYYTIQGHRIEAQNQVRALADSEEPNTVLEWLYAQHHTVEKEIAKVLAAYADRHVASAWAQTLLGIGPVLSAGLMAHIDIEKAPTVGHIWRFAGLDPTVRWEPKTKRPWNAALKVLCWKMGESFVKVSGRPCIPGGVIPDATADGSRPPCKALEESRNDQLLFADQAEKALTEKKYDKSTDAYKAYAVGRLPQARIHARAKRYAVKLFLAHFHHVLYESTFGEIPPRPYVIEHLGHTHYLSPPNWKDGKIA